MTALVESAADAIITKTLDGIIKTWNPAAVKLLGYLPGEIIGRPVTILLPGNRVDEEALILERIRRGELVEHFETVRRRRDGSFIDVSLTISPIVDRDGRIVGASKIMRNITEQKRIEGELLRSNADLEQFAYLASHDLQEPLRMVASYTELLAHRYKGKLDERADKFIAYAVDGARRMQSLVTGLLEYSRIGPQGAPLVPVSTDEVLKDVLAVLRKPIAISGATIEDNNLPVVLGDASQLRQVFQNLISNAIKFNRDGTVPVIEVTAHPHEYGWLFSVSDNGIGFEMEHADRIFQMFQRLNERGKYDGSGIGLAMVKRILERHNGRIWVESTPDIGTTFFFILPRAA